MIHRHSTTLFKSEIFAAGSLHCANWASLVSLALTLPRCLLDGVASTPSLFLFCLITSSSAYVDFKNGPELLIKMLKKDSKRKIFMTCAITREYPLSAGCNRALWYASIRQLCSSLNVLTSLKCNYLRLILLGLALSPKRARREAQQIFKRFELPRWVIVRV